jgi:hypothetical protein
VVGDGDNGVFTAWEVLSPEDGKEGPHSFDKIILIKVDAKGVNKLQQELFEKGMKMVADGIGGVILGWAAQGDHCILRKDGYGNILWTHSISVDSASLNLSAGENGESFILWRHLDHPYFVVQKLDADGQSLWGQEGMPEGVRIKHLDTALLPEPQIVSDGSGGAIISWAEPLGEGLPSYVWACRIRATGDVHCDEPVRDLPSIINIYTRVVTDSSGGAIVIWEDHRDDIALYAQKVDTEAQAIWQENGVPVCTDLPDVSPRFEATSNGDGGVIIVYIDGDRNLYAQMLDSFGEKKWSEKGILLAKGVCDLPVNISGDMLNGFIVGWYTGKDISLSEKYYIQKINAEGELTWGDPGIRLDNGN